MDEQKNNNMGGGHGGWCSWCGHGYGEGQGGHGDHRHFHGGRFILRIVLMIIVIAIAFSVGVKLGEIKAELYYSGYGYSPMHSMMGGWYGNGSGGYGAYPMMQYYYGTSTPAGR